jgi:uncharacterized protein
VKRAVILSDSHGDEEGLRWMLEQLWQTIGPVDYYIHLGDGARDFQRLENFLLMRDPKCMPIGVKGNCDYGVDDVPMQRMVRLGDKYLMVCHGHHYAVKQTYSVLAHHAREQGCDAALFGHTHRPYCEEEDGFLLLNPGSAADGRLAVLTADDDGKLSAELKEF